LGQQGELGAKVVLLHEWRVGLYVRRDLGDVRAVGMSDELGEALRRWANERTPPGDHYNLTVEA